MPHLPRLYSIVDVDAAAASGWRAEDLTQAVLDGGGRCVQLRAKHLTSGAFLALAVACAERCRAAGATFLVNDRADVAVLAGADGVHLGQDDLSPADARLVVGSAAIVGWSTHTPPQVSAALETPATYLAVGPVFETGTKATGYQAVGLGFVSATCSACAGRLPVVAIGGITLENAPDVVAAGADAVAVIADLLRDGDPRRRVGQFIERLGRV